MRRERALRKVGSLNELSSREAVRLCFHQQAKRIQPGRMRKRGKGGDCIICGHPSDLTDTFKRCNKASGISDTLVVWWG
ncbi:MAG: hypothetical protein ABW128_00295, partial [Rhizorhabdus sp.]